MFVNLLFGVLVVKNVVKPSVKQDSTAIDGAYFLFYLWIFMKYFFVDVL